MPPFQDVYTLAGTAGTIQTYPSAVHESPFQDATVAGPTATITVLSPAGAVSADATVAGPVATITSTSPSGAVSTDSVAAGAAGAIGAVAPAGTVSGTAVVAGVVVTISTTAPAGATSAGATVAGPISTITTASPDGTVTTSATVAGPVTTITTTASAGAVLADAAVAGPSAAIVLVATYRLRLAMEYGEPMVRLVSEPALALDADEVLVTRGAGGPEVLDAGLRTAMSVGVPEVGELLERPTAPITVSLADLTVGEPMTVVRTSSVATRLSMGGPLASLVVGPATDRNPSI